MNRYSSLFFAGASVALIILVDLVTGQGPPGLNSYLGPAPQPDGYPVRPMGYLPQYEVSQKYGEKEYEKGGKSYENEPLRSQQEKESYKKDGYKSTPAPGVLSSFSNSMSDAWKTLSSLGRQKRDAESRRIKVEEQFNNQGYIFFKVPKSLVCYN